MYIIIVYLVVFVLLIISLFKSRTKTKEALNASWKYLKGSLGQFIALMLVVIYILAIIDKDTICKNLGKDTGILGMLLGGLVGSVTIIPAVVAFPLSSNLLRMGAGISQITVLLNTLTMVGIITLPMEKKCFGTKNSIVRNLLCFIYSLLIGLVYFYAGEYLK